MTGPPTPPPTTATELHDEARGSVATSSISESVLRQEPYTYKFTAIMEAARQNKLEELIQIAEQVDLAATGDRQATRLLAVAPLVLAYLILDELPPARYAVARLPDNLISHPLSQGLNSLLKATIERRHSEVYRQAENLCSLATNPDFFDQNLASVIVNMVQTFIESFRRRTFDLLSSAYVSLPVPLGCVYLGLPAEDIIHGAEKSQWSYEPIKNSLIPKTSEVASKSLAFSSLSTFHLVTASVAMLES